LGQLVRFAVVGATTTGAYLLLYAVLRDLGLAALVANLISSVATTMLSTTMHRRFTFAAPRTGLGVWQQVQGLLLFALGFALTSGALTSLTALASHPARPAELTVLVVATAAAGLFRFVMLRTWVFGVA
jgi:putative flippase GtrA